MLLGKLFFFAKYLEAAEGLNPALINSLSSFFINDGLKLSFFDSLIPLITIVNSPKISLSLKKSITLSIVSPTFCSNFFVNSRKTCISLSPPQLSFNSSRRELILCGDSNNIVV